MDLDELCDRLQNISCWEGNDNHYYQIIKSHLTSNPDMSDSMYQLISERYRKYLSEIKDWGNLKFIKEKILRYLNEKDKKFKYNLNQEIDGFLIKLIDGLNDPRFIKVLESIN